jgi:hypothetical protein
MAAQQLFPGKRIAFTQIVAGGGYTSVVNLTNRGTTPYSGTLNLTTGGGQGWSPVINGTPISNGSYIVTIAAGATVTLTITSPGSVAAGFGVISTTDNSLTNSVEGTLTYYIKSGTGAVLDSVGIAPASEFFLTTIPFDDFNTIAVALANLNPFGVTAKMTVFSDTGQVVGTINQLLLNMQHLPQYLSQFFPAVSLTRGRLEIQCDNFIIGEALTQVQGGQYSSLPLLPALKTYTWTMTTTGPYGSVSTGNASVWINGSSVSGVALAQGAGSTSYITGQVSSVGPSNSLVFYGNGNAQGLTYVQYFSFPSFTFSATTATGTVTTVTLDGTVVVPGTMTMTATN